MPAYDALMVSKKLVSALATCALALTTTVALSETAQAANPKIYKNCTALNKAYPHLSLIHI